MIATLGLVVSCGSNGPQGPGAASVDCNGPNYANSLPSTENGIHLAIIFDRLIPRKCVEPKYADYVWGTQVTPGMRAFKDGLVRSAYQLFASSSQRRIDDAPGWPSYVAHHPSALLGRYHGRRIGSSSYDWFLANHPDWLEYTAPAVPARNHKVRRVFALDITNPAVRDWMFAHYLKLIVSLGYNSIGFDNTSTLNYSRIAGIYRSASRLVVPAAQGSSVIETAAPLTSTGSVPVAFTGPSGVEYRTAMSEAGSGPYEVTLNRPLSAELPAGQVVGVWQRQYNGAIYDPTFQRAMVNAFASLTSTVRAYARSLHRPLTIAINDGMSYWQAPNVWYQLLPFADLVLDESGFTNYGYVSGRYLSSDVPLDNTVDPWLTKMQGFQWLNAHGEAFAIINIFAQDVSKTPLTEAQIEWCLANYLLIKGQHSYLAMLTGRHDRTATAPSGKPEYNVIRDLWQYHAPIGHPISESDQPVAGGPCWVRQYSNGVAYVDPSSKIACTVTLLGSLYRLGGAPVKGSVSLSPESGLVLLSHRWHHP